MPTTPKRITKTEWEKKVLESVKDNHIWLNAFGCINPTKEFCEDLGRIILDMLNNKEKLIHSEGITSENGIVRELAELTPYLYLSINKS